MVQCQYYIFSLLFGEFAKLIVNYFRYFTPKCLINDLTNYFGQNSRKHNLFKDEGLLRKSQQFPLEHTS